MEDISVEKLHLIYSILFMTLAQENFRVEDLMELKETFMKLGISEKQAENMLSLDDIIKKLKMEDSSIFIEILAFLIQFASYDGFLLPVRISNYFDIIKETEQIPVEFFDGMYVLAESMSIPKIEDLPE